jgi:hypothetical protein
MEKTAIITKFFPKSLMYFIVFFYGSGPAFTVGVINVESEKI